MRHGTSAGTAIAILAFGLGLTVAGCGATTATTRAAPPKQQRDTEACHDLASQLEKVESGLRRSGDAFDRHRFPQQIDSDLLLEATSDAESSMNLLFAEDLDQADERTLKSDISAMKHVEAMAHASLNHDLVAANNEISSASALLHVSAGQNLSICGERA